jgi:hypothetical protein
METKRALTLPNQPNNALQRTAPRVTAPASAAAFPRTMQVPCRPPQSLSFGSLDARLGRSLNVVESIHGRNVGHFASRMRYRGAHGVDWKRGRRFVAQGASAATRRIGSG